MRFLLRLCAIAAAAMAPLWAREPTAQDYEVWSAVLSERSDGDTVYVWRLVEPTRIFDRGRTKFAFSFFPEARPVAAAWAVPAAKLDLDKLRFAQQRIARSRPPPNIKVLDGATLRQAAGKSLKSVWLISPELLPEADAIYRLSWPAYREDGRAAFLICAVSTRWWGSIIEYQVNKHPVDGTWRLGRIGRTDYTDWKNGELVVEMQSENGDAVEASESGKTQSR